MLGCYFNFPTKIHGVTRYTYHTSTQQLQRNIVKALRQLNQETLDLAALTKASPANCQLNFEFGIADQFAFNFLDDEELERFLRMHDDSQGETQVLDFLCAARYSRVTDEGKRIPLRFDYTLLRFVFYERNMETFIAHERGSRRIPLEDLIVFLTDRIGTELKRNGQKPLKLEHLHVL